MSVCQDFLCESACSSRFFFHPPNYPLLDLGTLNWLLLDIKSDQTLCAYYEEINYAAYSFQPCPKQTYSQLGISLSWTSKNGLHHANLTVGQVQAIFITVHNCISKVAEFHQMPYKEWMEIFMRKELGLLALTCWRYFSLTLFFCTSWASEILSFSLFSSLSN